VKRGIWLLLLLAIRGPAAASDGGLYVAGGNFYFREPRWSGRWRRTRAPALFRADAVGTAVRGLSVVAPPEMVEFTVDMRWRAAPSFLVCQRDIDRQLVFTLLELVPGVIAVRGWPSRAARAALRLFAVPR
jgi:hypothetical protein